MPVKSPSEPSPEDAVDRVRKAAPRLGMEQLTITCLDPGQTAAQVNGFFSGRSDHYVVFSQMRTGHMEFERNGVPGVVRTGEAYLARPGHRSRMWHYGPQGGTFSATWCFLGVTAFGGIDLGGTLDLPPVLDRKRADAFAALIAEAIAVRGDGLAAQVRRCEIGFRMFGQLLAVGGLTREGTALVAGANRLAPVLTWCREHLAEDIGPEDMAKVAGCSRARLYAQFHDHLDCAPRQWLTQVRIARARELLLSGQDSVAEVSRAVGFANPYHFSRVFRASAGEAPGRWRRAQRYLEI